MKLLSLALPGAAVLAALASIAAWFLTQGKLDQKQDEISVLTNRLTTTETDLADARDQIAGLTSDLKVTRTDLAEAKQKATQNQDLYFQANQEVSKLQTALTSEQETVKTLTSDNDRLKREILAVKSAPPPDIDNSEVVLGYKDKIADMEAEIQDLQSRLRGAPLPNPTINRSSTPQITGLNRNQSISAGVAAVQMDKGMVVFNKGMIAGIQKDREYSLLKNGTSLGRVRVTALSDTGSVGLFISSTEFNERINIGDPVLLTP